MEPLIRHPIVQYAYYTDDIDAAVARWVAFFGAGPFFASYHHKSENVRHKGRACEADVSYAFGFCGAANIQLIQQHNDAPSTYRDMYPRGGEGFHHVAILVPDYPGEVARFETLGCPLNTELVSAARVGYVDARRHIGCFVELYEDNPAIRATFKDWHALHQAWDGRSEPLRRLG